MGGERIRELKKVTFLVEEREAAAAAATAAAATTAAAAAARGDGGELGEPGGDDLGNVLALELLEEQGGALGVGVDANCAVLKFGLVFCCLDGQGGALVSG